MSSKHSLTPFLALLDLNDYIAFDLETTGLNPLNDCITEIAAYRFVNGEPYDQYSTLINPGISIPKNIVEITGITDEMVADAPLIEVRNRCIRNQSHHQPSFRRMLFLSRVCREN